MDKIFIINGVEWKVSDFEHQSDLISFTLGDKKYSYTLVRNIAGDIVMDGGVRIRASVSMPNPDGDCIVLANGREAVISSGSKKIRKATAHAGGLTSPMPGKIFKIIKPAGSEVKKGEPILILEAMKMEHSIRSDKDGKVKLIFYKVGELVQGGVTLAEVEPL